MLYEKGKNYMIRTVTMIYTGRLVQETKTELVLDKCCWIAETERWATSCKTGEFKEVEPYPEKAKVIVMKGAVLDMFKVDWKLPKDQK